MRPNDVNKIFNSNVVQKKKIQCPIISDFPSISSLKTRFAWVLIPLISTVALQIHLLALLNQVGCEGREGNCRFLLLFEETLLSSPTPGKSCKTTGYLCCYHNVYTKAEVLADDFSYKHSIFKFKTINVKKRNSWTIQVKQSSNLSSTRKYFD